MMNVSVEVDLLADIRTLVANRLTADGYAVDPGASASEVVTQYLQIRHRQVPRRPRQVRLSTELRAREAQLPDWIRRALARITKAIEVGDDLNPYLSRQLASDKAFKKHDLLLND